MRVLYKMAKPAAKTNSKPDIRLDHRTLTPAATKAEWKRLGIKVTPQDLNYVRGLVHRMDEEYLPGYKADNDIWNRKKLPKSWQPPVAFSLLNQAFFNHKCEYVSTVPLSAGHRTAYTCYLAREGLVSQSNWTKQEVALMEVYAKYWEDSCRLAVQEQAKEGVFLNPRGLAILDEVSKRINVTNGRAQDRDLLVLRAMSYDNLIIGPGFENFFSRFAAWAKNQPGKVLEEVSERATGLTPWILENSPLPATEKGMMELLPLVEGLDSEGDASEGPGENILPLLRNASLSPKGMAVLVEWAFNKLNAPTWDEHTSAHVREIFKAYADSNGSFGSTAKIRTTLMLNTMIREHLGEDEDDLDMTDEDDEFLLSHIAMVPIVGQDPELRARVLSFPMVEAWTEMLYHSTGPGWASLATKIHAHKDHDETGFINALKYASARHMKGVDPKSLATLLRSKNREVRTQVLRLAALVTKAPASSVTKR